MNFESVTEKVEDGKYIYNFLFFDFSKNRNIYKSLYVPLAY